MMSQRAKNCLPDNCRRSRVDCRVYLHINGRGVVARYLLPYTSALCIIVDRLTSVPQCRRHPLFPPRVISSRLRHNLTTTAAVKVWQSE